MKVFTAQQMRDFDRAAIEDYGIPSIVLMENAALRVIEFLEAKFAPLSKKKIVVLCGKGNNGGDGLAIARHLVSCGCKINVLLTATKDELKGDALTNYCALENALQSEPPRAKPGWIYQMPEEDEARQNASFGQIHIALHKADLIIDALLGTGFYGEIRDERIKGAINFASVGYMDKRIAVDLPSALDSDTGEAIQNRAGRANYTVTFAAPKRGMFARQGIENCGEIWIGNIGTSPHQMSETQTGAQTLDLQTAKTLLPHRAQDAHKGDAGRALIVGGSFGMSGSICLASKAALASGAGLVSAAVPERVLPIFAASVLEAVSHPLPNDENGHLLERAADELPQLWKEMQVVALGPGLGRTDEAFNFARRVVRECPVPLVIDADALHALPAIAGDVKARRAPTILTPHPGEMGVLMGMKAGEVNDARFETVAACAQKYGATVVLKGARSLVCDSSGEIWVNLTGNAGMATGGAGDVLTGTIAGLLAQLKDADAATKLGVYLHGMAGDLAARTAGQGLVAGDIAAHLAAALLEIERREVEQINGRLRKLE